MEGAYLHKQAILGEMKSVTENRLRPEVMRSNRTATSKRPGAGGRLQCGRLPTSSSAERQNGDRKRRECRRREATLSAERHQSPKPGQRFRRRRRLAPAPADVVVRRKEPESPTARAREPPRAPMGAAAPAAARIQGVKVQTEDRPPSLATA